MIRILTASIGALFMLVAVFVLCAILITPFLPAFLQAYIHVGNVGTNNIAGIIFGPVAAASSFVATLRRKK